MTKVLNYIIFISLIGLIAIAHNEFSGSSPGSSEEFVEFTEIDVPHEVIYTLNSTKHISGYGGPIPMAVAIDDEGIILDIQVLDNSESPSHLSMVLEGGFLSNWIGKSAETAASLEIDAMSGATLSSEAISQSLKTSMADFSGIEVSSETSINYDDLYKLAALLLLTFGGLALFFRPKKLAKHRTTLLVTSVIILGVWQGEMLSVTKIAAWVVNGVPIIWGYGLLFIFIVSISIPFFTGKNFYCYYLCPFGAAQEIVGKSINVKTSISKHIFSGFKKMRFVMLLVCFILAVLGLGSEIVLLEPFAGFQYDFAPLSAVILFVSFLLLSIFISRPWCKYFCPCGAFLDLFKKTLIK